MCRWIACAFVKMEHVVIASCLFMLIALVVVVVDCFDLYAPKQFDLHADGRGGGREGQSLSPISLFTVLSAFTRYLVYIACLCRLACFSVCEALLRCWWYVYMSWCVSVAYRSYIASQVTATLTVWNRFNKCFARLPFDTYLLACISLV